MAAEPGKETVAPAPPPREPKTVDGRPAEAEIADLVAPLTSEPAEAPHAVVEPGEETTTPPPPPPPRETEPTDGVAPALDPALPTAESARRAPPQEKPDAAAAGPPEQTTTEAGGLPPTPTKAEEVAALPPPAEKPSLGRVVTAAVEAEKQLPVAAAPAPPQQQSPPQQQQESGTAKEASSVHAEKKDAAPVAAHEGEEKKPGEKLAALAPMAQDGRRGWRHLQAAVRLIFLRCKRAPRGDQSTPQSPMPEDKGGETKPPASVQEEKKPTLADEGETKPPAPGGEQQASGQEQVATSPPPPPPPTETSSLERAATAAEAEKPLAAPPPQQPPQKEEGGAPGQASSVQEEEEKGAAPAKAPEGEEKPARRRWRRFKAAVLLLFLRPNSSPRHGDQLSMDKEDEVQPPAPAGKQPASGLEDRKTIQAEKPQRKDSAVGVPAEPHKGEMKPSAPDGEVPASGQKEQKPATAPKPYGKDSTGGVLDKPGVKRKDERGESKRRHDESQAGAVAGGDAGPEGTPAGNTKTTSPPGSLAKKFQKAVKRLLGILSWYKEHRSSRVGGEPQAGAPPMEEGKGADEIKPATAPDGDKGADAGTKPSPADGKQPASGSEEEKRKKWEREEERLEEILEGAFTRLLAAEYHQLRPIRKKCLLTFSVFDLASEVKKQVMVYWWVSEFNLRHRSDQSVKSAADAAPTETRRSTCWQARKTAAAAAAAGSGGHPPAPEGSKAEDHGGKPDAEAEGIFSELSSHGFLEPMKNWCSRVIHGCKVNPLVHWMLKRRARDDRFADLDVKGSPADLQHSSSILCLTARNRELLQKMRMADESQQAGNKTDTTTTTSQQKPGAPSQDKAPDQDPKNTESIPIEEIAKLFKRKQVILNVNAHVYPVSKSTFFHLADSLVVLQLGRWCNLDDKTYMEVDGLESLSTIGLLKNLRYLSLRGLSRLTELPKGIRWLRKLAILDMRGCQNLVNVASKITTPLKQLTHLDLTECYMLEHIGRGITSVSELQVFKGFVFATGTQGNKACRLQDLKRLRKLQKLTVRITTDANVGRSEMAELKHLTSLRKLTITWSEIPSILDGDSDTVKGRRAELIEKWTSFELPQELLKLDLRCYPKNELKLKKHQNLKKLYLRGGDLERFSIGDESKPINSSEKTNSIKTLRLRYLKNFSMEWKDIRLLLGDIEYMEIVTKDEKLMKDVNKDQKDIEEESKLVKDVEIKGQKDRGEEPKPVKEKKIIYSTLDENGVWVKDQKEEDNLRLIAQASKEKEAQDAMEKSKGPIEDPNKAASIVKDANEDDNTRKRQSEGKQEHVATDEVPQQLKTEPTPTV
ncbi:hypothetical protein SETIT_1G189000v2 [Setaria italica]|uniref:Disease resistance R13L4/SHOC-2-like LRR domain-containing protein n=1 Tax=Setaria italica TaxID=4555 RepID=A0A368PLV3_SETIT|nr:hypothetical protein SETIT_1G189000v2 [Setaria italica]RCV06757.1 hypothetical protein SETIT_1G189000v2 [Setaria italica]